MHFVFTKDQILLDVKIFLSLIRGQLFCATGTRFMKLGVEIFVELYESTLSSPVSSYVL